MIESRLGRWDFVRGLLGYSKSIVRVADNLRVRVGNYDGGNIYGHRLLLNITVVDSDLL